MEIITFISAIIMIVVIYSAFNQEQTAEYWEKFFNTLATLVVFFVIVYLLFISIGWLLSLPITTILLLYIAWKISKN